MYYRVQQDVHGYLTRDQGHWECVPMVGFPPFPTPTHGGCKLCHTNREEAISVVRRLNQTDGVDCKLTAILLE